MKNALKLIKDLQEVLPGIQVNDDITELVINASCVLDHTHPNAINAIPLLQELLRINVLNSLSFTKLDLGGSEGAKVLFSSLNYDCTLTYLRLSRVYIDDYSVEPIAEVIRHNKTITYMDLSSNWIMDAGAKLIGEALANNNTITYMDLRDNSITSEGIRVLTRSLEHNYSLVKLDILEYEYNLGKAVTGKTKSLLRSDELFLFGMAPLPFILGGLLSSAYAYELSPELVPVVIGIFSYLTCHATKPVYELLRSHFEYTSATEYTTRNYQLIEKTADSFVKNFKKELSPDKVSFTCLSDNLDVMGTYKFLQVCNKTLLIHEIQKIGFEFEKHANHIRNKEQQAVEYVTNFIETSTANYFLVISGLDGILPVSIMQFIILPYLGQRYLWPEEDNTQYIITIPSNTANISYSLPLSDMPEEDDHKLYLPLAGEDIEDDSILNFV